MRRTLALGDLHLISATPARVGDALEQLVASARGARLLIVGDLFDLSSEGPSQSADVAMRRILDRQASVKRALGGHLESGGSLLLVSGNHDASVGAPAFRSALTRALDLSLDGRTRLHTTPWLHTEGGLHVEHGHVYDPDNAPDHPLELGQDALGIHFAKEFLGPTGAHRYLYADDQTPLHLFLSAFRWYGRRAPFVVWTYFRTAFRALARSGPFYRGGSPERAAAALEGFLAESGVERRTAELCLGLAALPTMRTLTGTFSRLYFDRVFATTGLFAAGGLALAQRPRLAQTAFALSALAMGVSWAGGHDRFGGSVRGHLRQSALRIAGATGAKLVVFGHTHREALEEGYANTGSFSFPESGARGRPYLELAGTVDQPVAVRRYAPV